MTETGSREDVHATKTLYYVACGVDLAESSGGPIIHVVEAIDELQKLGYPVVLIGLYSEAPTYLKCKWMGEKVSTAPLLRHLLNTRTIVRLMRQTDMRPGKSLLYVRWGSGGSGVCRLSRSMGVPYWIEMNGIYNLVQSESGKGLAARFKAKVASSLERMAIKGAEGMFTTTAHMADYYADAYAYDRDRIVPNACGVNPETHKPSASPRIERRSDDPIVGFAGGLYAQSGFDILVAAAPEVVARFPAIRFKIIGTSDRAAYYRELVIQKGCREHFDFVGRVPYFEVSKQLAEVDVGLAPYISTPNLDRIGGGSPQKVYSYLACGKMTIISDLPYYLHFRDCQACFFAKPGDPQDLARAINEVLSVSPDRARELSEEARQYVVRHFTWRHNAQRIAASLPWSPEAIPAPREG